MKKLSLPLLALSGLVVLCHPAHARDDSRREVSVTGTAVIMAVPDTVVWYLSFTDTNVNLAVAKTASDQKLKSVLALCSALGIKDADVQTGQVDIDKTFERDQRGNEGAFRHFSVRRAVTIQLHETKRFDEFLTKLTTTPEVRMGVQLKTSRQVELRQEARLKALALAKTKADSMCTALGAKLGQVLTIAEEEPSNREIDPYSNSIQSVREVSADMTSGTFAPGALPIRASVRVVFAIE